MMITAIAALGLESQGIAGTPATAIILLMTPNS